MKAGDKFRTWTLIEPVRMIMGRKRWLCRCTCGAEKKFPEMNLENDHRIGCKCSPRRIRKILTTVIN